MSRRKRTETDAAAPAPTLERQRAALAIVQHHVQDYQARGDHGVTLFGAVWLDFLSCVPVEARTGYRLVSALPDYYHGIDILSTTASLLAALWAAVPAELVVDLPAPRVPRTTVRVGPFWSGITRPVEPDPYTGEAA